MNRKLLIILGGFLLAGLVVFLATQDQEEFGPTAAAPKPIPKQPHDERVQAKQSSSQPNIIFILTDDLSSELINYMPEVQKMQKEGVSFNNYVLANSLCCPSRASILTGKYTHNHKVFTNTPPNGGFEAFSRQAEKRTYATALNKAGYRTAWLGKYFNGYEPGSGYVPPGWDLWFGVGKTAYKGYSYRANLNGKVVKYRKKSREYITDELIRKSLEFISKARSGGQPFLLNISTFAPHRPAVPAARHSGSFSESPRIASPAFNQQMENPPAWLESRKPISPKFAKRLEEIHRLRAESMLAVDEMIGVLRTSLENLGISQNTYIFFSSDNGYHLGEHRLRLGKMTPFHYDLEVPLVAVGPGVAKGLEIGSLSSNIDLAKTFTSLGGVKYKADGRDLSEFLRGQEPERWRRHLLVDHHKPLGFVPPRFANKGGVPAYFALRSADELYIEYENGEREYHDLNQDPYELKNTYPDLSELKKLKLNAKLKVLKDCKYATCKALE